MLSPHCNAFHLRILGQTSFPVLHRLGSWGTEGEGWCAQGCIRREWQGWKEAPVTLHCQPVPENPPVPHLCPQQADMHGRPTVGPSPCGPAFSIFVLLSDFIPEPRWTCLLWLLTHHCKVKYTASPHWLRKINRTLSPPPTPTPTLPSELEIKNLQKDSRWLCQGGGMVRIGTVYNISALLDQSRFLIQ